MLKMNKLAAVLLCANFITVLFPQPGYIHPDEFFQSAEVVAGDVLKVQHFRTWEFNGTSAVRNIVFPYLVLSPSLYLVHWLNSSGIPQLQISTVKVVMATRLPVAFLSLFGYLATGRLADCFHVDRYISSILYCSSYVTWTYYTRTFSNSVESVLLAIVLLLVLILSGEATVHPKRNEARLSVDVKYEHTEISDVHLKSDSVSHISDDDHADDDDDGGDEISLEHKPTLAAAKNVSLIKGGHLKSETENICQQDATPDKKNAEGKMTADTEKADTSEVKHRNKSEDSRPMKKATGNNKMKSEPDNLEMNLELTVINSELSILRTRISYLVSFLLGAVVMAGFFNRPTFVVFTVVPVMYWILVTRRDDRYMRWKGVALFSTAFYFSCGVFWTFLTFVLLDTIYFNEQFSTVASEICIGDVSVMSLQNHLHKLLSSLVITPWNFIRYNTNVNNLASHGLHPWYMHVFVNLPLLLGPLYILFVVACIVSLLQLVRSDRKTTDNSMAWLSVMSLVPVLCLSVFPHQEPRFLIPALPVFIVTGAKLISATLPGRLSFFAVWAVFNIFLTLVYGYMHQAALIPALSIFQQKFASPSSHLSKSHHAIFYKTYPPPRHLLLLQPGDSQVSVHELAGAPLNTFLQTLNHAQSSCRASKSKCQINVFLPSTVTPVVLKHIADKTDVTSICPHLTMEDPPRLWAWWRKRLSLDDFIMDFCLNIITVK